MPWNGKPYLPFLLPGNKIIANRIIIQSGPTPYHRDSAQIDIRGGRGHHFLAHHYCQVPGGKFPGSVRLKYLSQWMDNMILHHSITQYMVYLKALGLPSKRLKSYQQALVDIDAFYGPDTPLEYFDDALVLEYVKVNDPFETDPVKVVRGSVFCKFTLWLMKNHLIPAWAEEMQNNEKGCSVTFSGMDDFETNDQRYF